MRHKAPIKRIVLVAVLAAFAVFWSLVFLYVEPAEFLREVGVENGYLLLFIIAALGGVSSLTFTSYIGTLLFLASAGLNPVLLGLVSGAGVTIGDTVYYLLGYHGRTFIQGKFSGFLRRASAWVGERPTWLRMLLTYTYVAAAPLPNDILAVALGALRCSYASVIVPLVLGNVTHTILIAVLGRELFSFFS